MRVEAASAGFYASPWGTNHPRLQIRTVAEMLAGQGIDMPPSRDLRTFKKAPKAKGKGKAERPDYSVLPFMSRQDDPTSVPSAGETGAAS